MGIGAKVMTQIHWANPVDGDFGNQLRWAGSLVPGSSDEAFIDAVGAYTVSVTNGRTVHSLVNASSSVLAITRLWTVRPLVTETV